MSPNKRKILKSDISDDDDDDDDDDSFKRRRTSLRVNLSYSENLTDSGNGSLWKTEIDTEKGTDTVRTNRRLLRGKRNDTYKKNRQADFDNEEDSRVKNDTSKLVNKDTNISFHIKEGIQLKRLTVNLEDMNLTIKEKALETNCKRLKDAILNKTQEIFDRENEFSIKTAMILKDKRNHFAHDKHDANIENKSVVILDAKPNHQSRNKAIMEHEKCTNIVSNQHRDNEYSNIVTTPTNGNQVESSKKAIDKSRLTQRRLFAEEDKQMEGQAKCKIIEDIILKDKFPLFSLRQTDQISSPILSGSNRRLTLRRTRSKILSQNQSEKHNTTFSTIQSDDIGVPIICSTFNENMITEEKDKNSPNNEANSDADTSRATYTVNKVISMEMTEVHGGIRMSQKYPSLQSTNSSNSIETNKKKESKGKSPEQNETKNHERRTLFLSDSDNTNRSSLNVNTSLDAMTEADKEENVRKTNDYKANNSNQSFKVTKTNNKKSTALDNQFESSNITETSSMKMNTSVNSIGKIWQRRSNHFQSLISDKNNEDTMKNHPSMDNQHLMAAENEEANDVDSLENISLIERLRNISTQNQVFHNNKSKVSETKEKLRIDNRSNIKLPSSDRKNNSGDSYVEGTPYPISRSVLFRTLLRHKTQNLDNSVASCSNNLNSVDNKESNAATESSCSNSLKSMDNKKNDAETKSGPMYSNTVILKDTSSDNSSVIQDQLTIIKDTDDETRFETDEKNTVTTDNMECTSVRKGRKKLLPLNDNSQLCSFTPVEKDKCIVEESISPSTSTKKNKKLTKKRRKRKLMGFMNDTSSIKRNISHEQTWSDNDCKISKKKKKDKKIQKPRKVISKKIIIKKFADESMLKDILKENRQQNKEDESIENRDSLNDFTKHRTIPTQRNTYKSKKIVIVTTGLSKGDRSLVKSIVKSLGKAEIEMTVSKRTTHVVSTGVRTVNLLRGIIRGCWLINLEWVLKSLENNDWLDPEEFEMKHFSKAVQENRKDKQLFGFSYIPELFATCGLIHVEPKTTVPCQTLKELVKTAGGHITENIKLAKIIIGINGLKETWIIDSITTGELQLTKLYQRK
ncbi:putative uncharacterized protein DDB_G0282133 [Nylanderia fulva]|uniref:putative uncharacterized protein DDB_G0282133 n=1 Tax=Nylanderia fulva TaxID=613905 RepID=UPI0010FBB807|nr:putative uncharacterized protein DDB_G0282133 [Nylanderia fulva]XP_029154858.1 putative uncharacterized protein DDB_G0282133 [Nylanderia fulva]